MVNFIHKNDIPENLVLSGDLAIDCESMGLNIARDRLCMVQISNGNGDAHLVDFTIPDYRAPNLKKLLSQTDIVKIFHFARFDVAIIYKYLGVLIENIYCTKIASKFARTYTESHGLKDLCHELLAIRISKLQQSSDWGNENLSKEQYEYAAYDVLYLHQLRDKLNQMLEREHRKQYLDACFKFMPHLVRLEAVGWDETIFNH